MISYTLNQCCGSALAFQCESGYGFSFLPQCASGPGRIRDQGASCQTYADPCWFSPDPGLTLPSLKVKFDMQNILYEGNRSQNKPTVYVGAKAFLKLKSDLLVNFGQLTCSWIRVGLHSQYGSGFKRVRLMRIHADPDPDPQHCFKYLFSKEMVSQDILLQVFSWIIFPRATDYSLSDMI